MSDTLQVRLDPERKKRWKRIANENPKYRNMTDLVITAVYNEITENSQANTPSLPTDEITEPIDEMSRQLNDVEDQVDQIYGIVRSDNLGGYDGLRETIQELIPSGDRDEILGTEVETEPSEVGDDERRRIVSETGSIPHLGRLLMSDGYDFVEIRGVIDQLCEDVAAIDVSYARPQEEEDRRIYRVED